MTSPEQWCSRSKTIQDDVDSHVQFKDLHFVSYSWSRLSGRAPHVAHVFKRFTGLHTYQFGWIRGFRWLELMRSVLPARKIAPSWLKHCVRLCLTVAVISALMYLIGMRPYPEQQNGDEFMKENKFLNRLFDTSFSFNVTVVSVLLSSHLQVLSFSDHGPDELQLFSKANHQTYCDKFNIRYKREFSETDNLKDIFSSSNKTYDPRFLKINSILSAFQVN